MRTVSEVSPWRLVALLVAVSCVRVEAMPPPGSPAAERLAVVQADPSRGNEKGQDTEGSVSSVGFDAFNVSLLSRIPLDAFPLPDAHEANEVWGYTSPSGREYALFGVDVGAAFVEVTNPTDPVIIAQIPHERSTWSDFAVYDEYCYVVNERGGGVQIIDLREIDSGVVTLMGTASGEVTRAHNIYANPDSGYLYPCASNVISGFIVFDLSDPTDPQRVGAWDESYVHDILVVSYDDCPYAGRTGGCEIAFAFACGNGLKIVDVTDKLNMVTISTHMYPNTDCAHQGWLSEDRRHLFIDDEGDEFSFGTNTKTHVVDVQDLANPLFVTSYTHDTVGVDHNLMVRSNYVFEANYVNGLRILDISDLGNIQTVGYFDTSPTPDAVGFDGAWGVYAALPSGVILVSDRQEGLFVLDPFEATGCLGDEACFSGNPCTVETCLPDHTCSTSNVDAETACDDGNNCTINGQCDGNGTCVSTDVDTIPCADDSPCVPGSCDVEAGFCTCIPCVSMNAPQDETFLAPKNRFLVFEPQSPGASTALQVSFEALAPPYDQYDGLSMWVGPPHEASENGANPDPIPGFPNFAAATLQCTPFFMDWGAAGPIAVSHPVIVPSGRYSVRAISQSCLASENDTYSGALIVFTSKWGDVVADLSDDPPPPPDGNVTILDALAIIGSFGSVPGAAAKARSDLEPGLVDLRIGITDVLSSLTAFNGLPFPFDPPDPPPPCGP